MTLLHIASSPRGEASHSLSIARSFLDNLSGADVEEWNLWDGSLPAFGPDAAAAKMRIFAGEEPEGAEKEAWDAALRTFDRFASADSYVFSVPMWNAGVPYILKQFIDVVSQPGKLFGFDPQTGYTGLLRGKRAMIIYTSAVYGPARPASFGADFQAPYLEDWLRWAGVTDISMVEFRPNLATADAAGGLERARSQAAIAARSWADESVAR